LWPKAPWGKARMHRRNSDNNSLKTQNEVTD
jgi:hypothetical protein